VTESMTEAPMPTHEDPDAQAVLEATGKSAHAGCLFCGKQNPIGFKLAFRAREDGSVQAVFPCKRPLQSYPETLHGGVVSALLDSAMTNCLFSKGIVAVTGELTVRFLSPVRLEHPAEVTAIVTRVRGPLYYLQAELTQGCTLTTRAQATFMKKDRTGVGAGHGRGSSRSWSTRERPRAGRGCS
jgi:uncharacterized protein (TIGR00369 family)